VEWRVGVLVLAGACAAPSGPSAGPIAGPTGWFAAGAPPYGIAVAPDGGAVAIYTASITRYDGAETIYSSLASGVIAATATGCAIAGELYGDPVVTTVLIGVDATGVGDALYLGQPSTFSVQGLASTDGRLFMLARTGAPRDDTMSIIELVQLAGAFVGAFGADHGKIAFGAASSGSFTFDQDGEPSVEIAIADGSVIGVFTP